jgi:hypothetical protein
MPLFSAGAEHNQQAGKQNHTGRTVRRTKDYVESAIYHTGN